MTDSITAISKMQLKENFTSGSKSGYILVSTAKTTTPQPIGCIATCIKSKKRSAEITYHYTYSINKGPKRTFPSISWDYEELTSSANMLNNETKNAIAFLTIADGVNGFTIVGIGSDGNLPPCGGGSNILGKDYQYLVVEGYYNSGEISSYYLDERNTGVIDGFNVEETTLTFYPTPGVDKDKDGYYLLENSDNAAFITVISCASIGHNSGVELPEEGSEEEGGEEGDCTSSTIPENNIRQRGDGVLEAVRVNMSRNNNDYQYFQVYYRDLGFDSTRYLGKDGNSVAFLEYPRDLEPWPGQPVDLEYDKYLCGISKDLTINVDGNIIDLKDKTIKLQVTTEDGYDVKDIVLKPPHNFKSEHNWVKYKTSDTINWADYYHQMKGSENYEIITIDSCVAIDAPGAGGWTITNGPGLVIPPIPDVEPHPFTLSRSEPGEDITISIYFPEQDYGWVLVRDGEVVASASTGSLVGDISSGSNAINIFYKANNNKKYEYVLYYTVTQIEFSETAVGGNGIFKTPLPNKRVEVAHRFGDTKLILPETLPPLFTDLSYLCSYNGFDWDVTGWDVGQVTRMVGVFKNANNFNQNISNWDTSNVTDMSGMFEECWSFDQDISTWDTSNVTDMNRTFYNATVFNQDIKGWDVSNVTNMNEMFVAASAFNQDISGWDVSKVLEMAQMFNNAKLFNQDLSSWCVSNITSTPYQFDSYAAAWKKPKPVWGTCPQLDAGGRDFEFTTVSFLSEVDELPLEVNIQYDVNKNWTLKDKTTGDILADGSGFLATGVKRNNFGNNTLITMKRKGVGKTNTYVVANHNNNLSFKLGDWSLTDLAEVGSLTVSEWGEDVTRVSFEVNAVELTVPSTLPERMTSLELMFHKCNKFNQDISRWDVSNVTNMNAMFKGCTSFNQDISGWNVGNVTNMSSMFQDAVSFNQDISGWNTSKVTVMSYMFNSAKLFNQDLYKWNVSKVKDMSFMFQDAISFNGDISTWNTSSVEDMMAMFQRATSYNGSMNRWVLTNCRNIKSMFQGCTGFNGNISDWNVSNVTNMANLFDGAIWFNREIGGWNVSNVTNMSSMFQQAQKFNQTLEYWNTGRVTDMGNMFTTALAFNKPIGNWDVSQCNNMFEMFKNASAFNQDLSKWCVQHIGSKPSNFDNTTPAWVEPRPVWGTCPDR